MDSNLKLILEEFEQLKGQFVITQSWRIERLIAIGTDEQDYYWITYDGRKKIWNTCVGSIIPLKGKIDDKHYNEFIRLAKLNHHDQATICGKNPDDYLERKEGEISEPITYRQLTEEHKKEMEQLKGDDKFLSEVCWELN